MSGRARRPLRVVQVIAGLNIGGAENVVRILATTIDRERFASAICCTRTIGVLGERLQTEAPHVEVMLAKAPGSLLRYLAPLQLRRRLTAFGADLVHSHGRAALLHTGPLAAMHALPPWVHTFHFGNYDRAGGGRAEAAEGFLARYATTLVAVSEQQRESVIRRHGIPASRIQTIVNGVAGRPNREDGDERRRKRAELGLGTDDVVVGAIAVLSEQKGLTYLLQAARRLVDRGCRARFVIVGGGPLEAALKEEAQALGLGESVIFTGWRPDGPELMSMLDVFAMPSLWEAMPMALLEAMAARRAVVVSDVGDNRVVVDGGRCGIVVAPRDVEALACAIGDLVADSSRRTALGLAACERHRTAYSVNQMIAGYEALYTAVASR
jgi:glycosyltransferase involved in cell wall biosynthesis